MSAVIARRQNTNGAGKDVNVPSAKKAGRIPQSAASALARRSPYANQGTTTLLGG